MEKRLIVFILLSIAVLYASSSLFSLKKEEPAVPAAASGPVAGQAQEQAKTSRTEPVVLAVPKTTKHEEKVVTIETSMLVAELSSRGAQVKCIRTKNYRHSGNVCHELVPVGDKGTRPGEVDMPGAGRSDRELDYALEAADNVAVFTAEIP